MDGAVLNTARCATHPATAAQYTKPLLSRCRSDRDNTPLNALLAVEQAHHMPRFGEEQPTLEQQSSDAR
jgi:hypothetical protein